MIDRLEREGRRFSFFQIVQLLLREQDGAEVPGRRGAVDGGFGSAGEACLRGDASTGSSATTRA